MESDEEIRNEKEIAVLKNKLEYIEKDIAEMKRIQEEHGKLIQDSSKEGLDMLGQINVIKSMLEDIAKRRVRFVDVFIAVCVLLAGAISAYSAMQANQVSRELLELTKQSLRVVNGG
jgi:hypothetical protein